MNRIELKKFWFKIKRRFHVYESRIVIDAVTKRIQQGRGLARSKALADELIVMIYKYTNSEYPDATASRVLKRAVRELDEARDRE